VKAPPKTAARGISPNISAIPSYDNSMGVAFLKNTELGRGQVAGDFKQVSNGA